LTAPATGPKTFGLNLLRLHPIAAGIYSVAYATHEAGRAAEVNGVSRPQRHVMKKTLAQYVVLLLRVRSREVVTRPLLFRVYY